MRQELHHWPMIHCVSANKNFSETTLPELENMFSSRANALQFDDVDNNTWGMSSWHAASVIPSSSTQGSRNHLMLWTLVAMRFPIALQMAYRVQLAQFCYPKLSSLHKFQFTNNTHHSDVVQQYFLVNHAQKIGLRAWRHMCYKKLDFLHNVAITQKQSSKNLVLPKCRQPKIVSFTSNNGTFLDVC